VIPSGAQWVPLGILTALGLFAVTLKARNRHMGRRRKMTGIAPDGHPDLDVTLSENETATLLGIETALRTGVGLAILDGSEGDRT
jgi:hypothetical protein